MAKDITKYINHPGSNANKHWNNETQMAYRGSVSMTTSMNKQRDLKSLTLSTPLSPKRFELTKSGLSKTVKKGNSRGS